MKTKDVLSTLTTAVLTLCALAITAAVLHREFGSRGTAPEVDVRPMEVRDWRSYTSARRHLGAADAPVTIVEFSDFQCPYCRELAARLDSLRVLYPRELALEYRHLPLPNHAEAISAARASECAGEQGKFWEMHRALFGRQKDIGQVSWTSFAADAGVQDSTAFGRCMASNAEIPGLRDDTLAAKRLAVRVTPTILINQWRLVGAQPLDTLKHYVTRAREELRR